MFLERFTLIQLRDKRASTVNELVPLVPTACRDSVAMTRCTEHLQCWMSGSGAPPNAANSPLAQPTHRIHPLPSPLGWAVSPSAGPNPNLAPKTALEIHAQSEGGCSALYSNGALSNVDNEGIQALVLGEADSNHTDGRKDLSHGLLA